MDDNQGSSKTYYQDLHKLYQRIKKLSKIDNARNEENVAAKITKEINDLIDEAIEKINITTTEDNSQSLRLFAMNITMFYERSKLLISLGDEKLSQETLITALNMITDYVSKSEIIFLAFRIINHYAYLLSKQQDYKTSREILEFSESIYVNAKKKSSVIRFFTSDDLFSPEEIAVPSPNSSNKLERLVTSNLQMLAFICNKQELHDKFAEYHHQVLKRQLEMGDEEITMWAIKSARLATYFLTKNRFKEARHHLSAAIHVLYEYEKELSSTKSSENSTEKWQDFQQKFADVAKCWVKYGLFLFSVSKTNIVTQFCGESNEILDKIWTVPFTNFDNDKSSTWRETLVQKSSIPPNEMYFNVDREKFANSRNSPGTLPKLLENANQCDSLSRGKIITEEYQGPLLIFESLILSEYENQVTASFVETTAQARALFLHTHAWLKRIKVFYSINEHPMEYVNAILDLSELYRYLAFYEENIESQYAVQKLRADALETLSTVLREIRPQCYMAVSIELLRELAQVQLEMMGLNLRRIYAAQEAIPESSEATLRKMEALADMHYRLEQFGDNSQYNCNRIGKIIPEANEAQDYAQCVI